MSLYAKNTTVPVAKSRMQIEQLLERHKAMQFGTAVDYEKLQARVQFRLNERIIRFVVTLPDRKRLGEGVRFERAERQKWRALLLVIKAKLEAVENLITTFEEEFLAHIVLPNDQTVSQIVLPQIAGAYKTGKMPLALQAAPEDRR